MVSFAVALFYVTVLCQKEISSSSYKMMPEFEHISNE